MSVSQGLYRRERVRVGKVSLTTKFYQAIGALPEALKNWSFSTFLLFYYNQVLHVHVFKAAVVVATALIIDAAIDPLNLNDFGNFTALNLSTVSPSSGGKDAWHQIWLAPCFSGSVDTASGLTFVGHLGEGLAKNGKGYLAAVSTATGTQLWQSPLMDAPVGAPPITYSVHGVQYVSVVVGGENHTDPTRPNPANPNQRVRGDSIYTYKLG